MFYPEKTEAEQTTRLFCGRSINWDGCCEFLSKTEKTRNTLDVSICCPQCWARLHSTDFCISSKHFHKGLRNVGFTRPFGILLLAPGFVGRPDCPTPIWQVLWIHWCAGFSLGMPFKAAAAKFSSCKILEVALFDYLSARRDETYTWSYYFRPSRNAVAVFRKICNTGWKLSFFRTCGPIITRGRSRYSTCLVLKFVLSWSGKIKRMGVLYWKFEWLSLCHFSQITAETTKKNPKKVGSRPAVPAAASRKGHTTKSTKKEKSVVTASKSESDEESSDVSSEEPIPQRSVNRFLALDSVSSDISDEEKVNNYQIDTRFLRFRLLF